ncbi:hypothetical protein K435DRAFT_868838 [Dendrothele bispora CBS 962.96]|uniref:Protein-S-isoprenylcysteine O-methyltransferase n=1 Tax=Dendrothele bispora (strain CBS 962.96) TaxID=1314807 RepID=A0A4S8LBE9_DENBC|nr:hypothetical protein K435DRAFT_868838 [Dendrothele bispora CBS 962.96]
MFLKAFCVLPKKDLVPVKHVQKWASTGGGRISRVFPVVTFLLEALTLLAPTLSKCGLSTKLLHLLPSTNNNSSVNTSPTFYLRVILLVLAAYIWYQCCKELGRHFTFEVVLLSDHKLITTGPYSIVRHPGYSSYAMTLGIFLIWFPEGSWLRESGFLSSGNILGRICLGAWTMWCGGRRRALTGRISKEDELLKKQFEKEWIEWEKNVPLGGESLGFTRLSSDGQIETNLKFETGFKKCQDDWSLYICEK